MSMSWLKSRPTNILALPHRLLSPQSCPAINPKLAKHADVFTKVKKETWAEILPRDFSLTRFSLVTKLGSLILHIDIVFFETGA
jgi:hypothetical protein